jgi:flavodoxin
MNSRGNSNAQSIAIACATAALVVVTGFSLHKVATTISNKNDDEEGVETKRSLALTEDEDQETTKTSVPIEIDLNSKSADLAALRRIQRTNTITVAYASTTGTCESFAKSLVDALQKSLQPISKLKVQICTVNELDWWDELLNNDNKEEESDNNSNNGDHDDVTLPPMVIFVLPTWTNGTLPEQFATLLTSLEEICHDWRVAPRPLRNDEDTKKESIKQGLKYRLVDTKTLQIASFGMGSTAYDKATFCKPAKDVFKNFMKLGAKSLLVSHGKGVVGTGDDDAGDCKKSFQDWKDRVVDRVGDIVTQSQNNAKEMLDNKEESNTCCQSNEEKSSCGCQEEKSSADNNGCCQTNDDDEDGFVEDDGADEYSDDDSDYDEEEKEEPDVMDLEDIGSAMQSSKSTAKKEPKAMVTPKQAIALKKEGYRIIGTHSAVKLCRWTKHQLRGRGGCYKHTFYGITSYQCMEATPSLACANKCKFQIQTFLL